LHIEGVTHANAQARQEQSGSLGHRSRLHGIELRLWPGDLEAHVAGFVDHYNHRRYHESLNNLTPADVYTGRGQSILQRRETIKRQAIEHRRLQHQNAAA
jgi:transposase InsO family protein